MSWIDASEDVWVSLRSLSNVGDHNVEHELAHRDRRSFLGADGCAPR